MKNKVFRKRGAEEFVYCTGEGFIFELNRGQIAAIFFTQYKTALHNFAMRTDQFIRQYEEVDPFTIPTPKKPAKRK